MTLLEPVPNTAAAVSFLKLVYPDGPWVLTAIRTDRKAIDTKTFRPSTEDDLLAWLNAYNGERNIYWSTNPPVRDLSKKAEREDIKEVAYLHVDIDPRPGEDVEAEQTRIFDMLVEPTPRGLPPPTCVIFSGGGYQAFWKLETPIPVNGDLALAEENKLFNLKIEQLLGGDNCHNIDRIMRLPGTINLPDEKKRKKGRRPALAKLMWFKPERVYPLSRFPAAPPVVSMALSRSGQSAALVLRGNVTPIEDHTELDNWNVDDRTKVIIARGELPDEPKEGDNSRSMWVFDACCQLARKNVPDNVILALLLDPGWGISESILDKGRDAERYAVRQIARAKDEIVEPWLADLNEKFFVVENEGGRTLVAEVIKVAQVDKSHRYEVSYQSFDNFSNRYLNRQVKIGEDAKGNPKHGPVGRWWLSHEQRRQVHRIVFRPDVDADEVDGCYNLWRGFAVTERPGDWSRLKAHIEEVLANGDSACADFILKWTAFKLQHPDLMPEVAMAFQGAPGSGKGTYGRVMTKLFGQHGVQVNSAAQFAGRFNGHLRDVGLLFADEAIMPNDVSAYGVLKGMITEPTLQIEDKGVKIKTGLANHLGIIMAVDRKRSLKLDQGDRRFASFEVSDKYVGNAAYFDTLNDEMKSGGLAAMLYDMRHNMPLGKWLPKNNIPETAARNELKEEGLSETEKMFLDMLKIGECPCHALDQGAAFVSAGRLHTFGLKRLSMRGDHVSTVKIADLFKKLKFTSNRNARPRHWVVPELPKARAAWDVAFMPVLWDEETEWAPVNHELQRWLADQDVPF